MIFGFCRGEGVGEWVGWGVKGMESYEETRTEKRSCAREKRSEKKKKEGKHPNKGASRPPCLGGRNKEKYI